MRLIKVKVESVMQLDLFFVQLKRGQVGLVKLNKNTFQ